MAYAVQGAAVGAPNSAPLRVATRRPFALLFLALTLALTLVAVEAPVVLGKEPVAEAKGSQATRIIKFARSHIGSRFRMGSEGQRHGRRTYFDCSGLVYRVYKEAGLLHKIGGARMNGTSYWHWFKRRGLVSKRNPKPGDLIIWGRRGKAKHIGIYTGDGRAISALINPWGVRSHRVNGLPQRVLAYLHVRLER